MTNAQRREARSPAKVHKYHERDEQLKAALHASTDDDKMAEDRDRNNLLKAIHQLNVSEEQKETKIKYSRVVREQSNTIENPEQVKYRLQRIREFRNDE